MSEGQEKKSVAQIVLENFLKDVEEKGTMPWQRPYERYDSFNYFTKRAYRGINRLILPEGEYLTRNQINQYNKEHGEDFKFQKGIEWYPVIFFKKDSKPISMEDLLSVFPNAVVGSDNTCFGYKGGWGYYLIEGRLLRKRNILRYFLVAERKHFRNSKGEYLPSRIESGEITITKQKPQDVWDSFIKRTGIKVKETIGAPKYIPFFDTIELNHHIKSEDSWFSTAFHEAAHATGHPSRFNRPGVQLLSDNDENIYAEEECIAEIASCLCCAETGITDMQTSCMEEYDSSVAYVQYWKNKVKSWGSSFIFIVSQADKAFNYICGNPDAGIDSADSDE